MVCFSNSTDYRGCGALRKAGSVVGKATASGSVMGPTFERYAVQVNLRLRTWNRFIPAACAGSVVGVNLLDLEKRRR